MVRPFAYCNALPLAHAFARNARTRAFNAGPSPASGPSHSCRKRGFRTVTLSGSGRPRAVEVGMRKWCPAGGACKFAWFSLF